MQVIMDKNNMNRVTAEKVSKRIAGAEPGPVKRISRIEREEEFIQKAMRKNLEKFLAKAT